MGRAPCCDKANVKKGPWSPEEDSKLKAYIEQHGTGGNWIALPQKVGLKRCGKSCRLRWLNYLRPNIKHGGFSEEEDSIICSLYVSIGSRWSIIAAQLPGRTDNDIKNYWNTRLKKKLLGKRKEHQPRRLISAALKEEAKDMQKRYDDSNHHLLCHPRGVEHTIPTPYSNLGHAIVDPREFLEKTASAVHVTMSQNSPRSDQPARFMINLHEGGIHQEISDNSRLKKMLQRQEGSFTNRSTDITNNNIVISSSHISTSIVNASRQIPQSADNLNVGQVINSYESAAPLYAKCMDNTKLQPMASALVDQNDSISLGFSSSSSMQTLPDSCSSPEGNYQSAMWMQNGLNADQNTDNNGLGYEFLMELNDLLYCNNNSSLPLQKDPEANYCCGMSQYMDALAASCWNYQLPSDPTQSSSSFCPINPYSLPYESGSRREIFEEEPVFELDHTVQ